MGARTAAVRVAAASLAAAAVVWAASNLTAVYVAGGSMAPALVQGDFAIARRKPATVRPGDVVLASKAGWPSGVLHRVSALNADGTLQLRGDANPTPDRDPTPASSLIGVVVCVVPTGRLLAAVESVGR